MRSSRRGRGFTIIELLVILAILTILLALIFPAVQKARDAAARARCRNNLKQLALGVLSYESSHGRFPDNALVTDLATQNWNQPNWSWIALVLPELEQGNLYRDLNIPRGTLWQARAALATPLALLRCPVDDGPPVWDQAWNLWGMPVGTTSYKGICSGQRWGWWSDSGIGAADLGHQPPVDIYDTRWPTTWLGSANGLNGGDGVFTRAMRRRPRFLRDFSRGPGQVLMLGEDLAEGNHHNAWPYANGAISTAAIPLNWKADPDDWYNAYGLRSRHPGGGHFACVDGSVRWLSDDIDLGLYRRLASTSGDLGANIP